MTDEKAKPLSDEEVRQTIADLAKFMREHETRDLERALWIDVMAKTRDNLTDGAVFRERTEARDATYYEDWHAQNSPAARREWQRHCAALTIMNGLLCGGPGTFEERLRLAKEANWEELTKLAYRLAETAMRQRELVKATEAAVMRTHGEIAVDLYREEPKEPSK